MLVSQRHRCCAIKCIRMTHSYALALQYYMTLITGLTLSKFVYSAHAAGALGAELEKFMNSAADKNNTDVVMLPTKMERLAAQQYDKRMRVVDCGFAAILVVAIGVVVLCTV